MTQEEVFQYVKDSKSITYLINPVDYFPNNDQLPVIIYKDVFNFEKGKEASIIENVFKENGWQNSWRNSIYNYHHYHSKAHEVIGIYNGEADIQLGGPNGKELSVKKGDVIILPAGVSHKCLVCSREFACIGAYPPGQNYDMNYGKEEEIEKSKENIHNLPLPETDPVYGNEGELIKNWLHQPIEREKL